MSPIQEATNTQLLVAKETTYGTAPNGSGDYQIMRTLSDSLEGGAEMKPSGEISGSRENAGFLRMGRGVSGSIETEFGYEHAGILGSTSNADLLEGLMMSSWGTVVDETGVTMGVTSGTGAWDSGSDAAFADVVVGSLIYITGMDDAANDGVRRVLTKTDSDNITTNAEGLVTDASSTGVRVQSEPLFVGTSDMSYTFQREYIQTTIANYFLFTGCMIASVTFDISANNEMKATWGVEGRDWTASSAQTGTNPAAKGTNEILTSNDVFFYEDGLLTSISEMKFTVTNPLRKRTIVGDPLATGYGKGKMLVEGSVKLYFANRDQFDDFDTNTEKHFYVRCTEPTTGGSIAFDFPSAKLNSYKAPPPGENDDVMAEYSFMCQKDSVVSRQFSAARFAP